MKQENAIQDKQLPEDDFWHERQPMFTAQFPTYYQQPQKVWGRFHTTEERFFSSASHLLHLTQQEKKQVYVMMQPFIVEPILTMTVGVYKQPKKYADMDSAIGESLGVQQQGIREAQIGNAQAWYYPKNKTIMLWECFFDSQLRKQTINNDENMPELWSHFETWLVKQFPDAKQVATPFNDPIANSIEEYQTFLQNLGYSPFEKAVFGKRITRK